MRKRIVPLAMALLLMVAGCSSSDPTKSDEYAALEQDLADVTADRDLLVEQVEAAAPAQQESNSATVPGDVAALTDMWGEAISAGGGAVTELYTIGGFHAYGNTIWARDEIATHLEAPSTEGVWVTDPFLLVDDGNGRYVVARGTYAAGKFPGSITFVIEKAADGELKIVETAWVYAQQG